MDHPKRFRLVGAFILAAGLLAAVVVYRTRPSDEEGDLPTKRDIYQLERIGGKANVVASELTTWFVSLWQGRKLAYTLGWLSIGGFAVCFLLADLLADAPPPEGPNRDNEI